MKHTKWSGIIRIVRWLIVVVIFVVIGRSIDWSRFFSVMDLANPWLILAGISYYPLVILMGALRWNTMLRAYHGERVHWTSTLKDYWSGLAIGWFAPASLGWDVYRVAVATKRYGSVVANSATIVVEKMMALLTCASLVTLLVPFMAIAADNRELRQIIFATHTILVGTLVTLVITLAIARHRVFRQFLQRISGRVIQWLDRLGQRNDLSGSPQSSLAVTFEPLFRPRVLARVTMFSFLIQLSSAVGNQIFFISVHHDIPLLVNLFVAPILYFVFLLPISFGSIGIREGAYILLYGAFGVPMEIALLVSFLNLTGILLNNLFGGTLLALEPNVSESTQAPR